MITLWYAHNLVVGDRKKQQGTEMACQCCMALWVTSMWDSISGV